LPARSKRDNSFKRKYWHHRKRKPIYVSFDSKEIIDKWEELTKLLKERTIDYKMMVLWFDNFLYKELRNDERVRSTSAEAGIAIQKSSEYGEQDRCGTNGNCGKSNI
jgi:hypothetical protein